MAGLCICEHLLSCTASWTNGLPWRPICPTKIWIPSKPYQRSPKRNWPWQRQDSHLLVLKGEWGVDPYNNCYIFPIYAPTMVTIFIPPLPPKHQQVHRGDMLPSVWRSRIVFKSATGSFVGKWSRKCGYLQQRWDCIAYIYIYTSIYGG